MNVIVDEEPRVVELTPEEGRKFFDRTARQLLDMSGEEFVACYDAGELNDLFEADDPRAIQLEMLLPFWRAGHPRRR